MDHPAAAEVTSAWGWTLSRIADSQVTWVDG
jgi:hypothetical protein